MSEFLRVERKGPIATVWIDRQAKMNTMTVAMRNEFPGIFAALEADDGVRVVIVRGAGGKAFSAGGDVAEFLTLAPADLVLELAARLQHDLLGFQVSRAVARFGVALGVADDAGGARARVTELAFADELLEQEPDKEGDDRDYGEQKPKWLSHRYVNPQRGCVVRRKYLSDLTV